MAFSNVNTNTEFLSNVELSIYPNPATDFINIGVIDADTDDLNVEIYSSSGQRVVKRILTPGEANQLDVSVLAPGMYIVQLKHGEKFLDYQRLLIQE